MAASRKQTKEAAQAVQNSDLTFTDFQEPQQMEFQPQAEGVKEYKPSDKVLAKLATLPKDEIKRQIGVDIDYLIKTTKHYGVLESLAYGQHTQRPISVRLAGIGKCYGTVKVYVNNKGELKCDVHPTNLIPKRDENGRLIQKKTKNGVPMYDSYNNPVYEMEYDRNPIKVGEPNFSLDRMGNVTYSSKDTCVTLTDEQMKELRLLGRLCKPIVISYTDDSTGKTTYQAYLINTNEYNNHKLLKYPVEKLKEKLHLQPFSRTFRQWVDKVPVEYELTDKQIDIMIENGGVWLGGKNDPENRPAVYVYYDILKDKLYKGVDKQYAIKQEHSQKATQAEARALEKELKQNQTVGKGQKL